MAGGEEGSPAAAVALLLPPAREERSSSRRRRCREGCPGCRQEEASKARAGVPYLDFFYIWVVCLAAGQSGPPAHTSLPVVGFPGVTVSSSSSLGCSVGTHASARRSATRPLRRKLPRARAPPHPCTCA